MNYCLVEDNIITDGPKNLPRNWRHVSGLDKASGNLLLELGWRPVKWVEVAHDHATHRRNGHTAVIHLDNVVLTDVIEAIPATEISQNVKNDAIAEIRGLENRMTLRLMREAHLGITDGRNGRNGKEELQKIEDLIQIQRDKL